MRRLRKLRLRVVLAGTAVLAVVAFAAATSASPPHEPDLSNVASANAKAVGAAPASMLSKELVNVVVAQGSTALENPAGIITNYGYENDVASPGDPTKPQMVPTAGPVSNASEAQKTEPDKNTYLVFPGGLHGPDPDYWYGTHFLYQGHELAATVNGQKQGYITRINLDADAAHRVTLLAHQDNQGNSLQTIDGSTWDPWARKLILTTESANAPTYSATADYPSTVVDVSGALGRGGFEAAQNDSAGNIYLVEDIGGASKGGTNAKRPNSFLYRYVPRVPGDLVRGRLEALQVLNEQGQPITFDSQAGLNAPDQVLLHSFGHTLATQWVTVHDCTNPAGCTSFNANSAAKAADATPFKRPENGQFRPGSGFREFYFDETGDTNATSPENPTAGGWGVVQKYVSDSPTSSTGQLELFYYGNQAHSGFDNVAFLSRDLITFVEDAGDTLHSQRNALDSGYVFDVTEDYSAGVQPIRWIAQGRDPSATIDSSFSGSGFKNDGDNEITGVHVSDGDPGPHGILGAQIPHLFKGDEGAGNDWRFFYTDQHGDNRTYEVVPAP